MLVYVAVVGCGGGGLGVACGVGCADVWWVFRVPSLVFASPSVSRPSAVSRDTSLPVGARYGVVTSVSVGGSSCSGVLDGSVGVSGDDGVSVASLSTAASGTVTGEPYSLTPCSLAAWPTRWALGPKVTALADSSVFASGVAGARRGGFMAVPNALVTVRPSVPVPAGFSCGRTKVTVFLVVGFRLG